MSTSARVITPGTIIGRCALRALTSDGRYYSVVMIADPKGKFTRADFVRYSLVRAYENEVSA